MKAIEDIFNGDFSHWDIRLPAEAIKGRYRGKIVKGGWTIWYLFGSDEKGEYLDYYAAHRMTNDRHLRIYADGSCEGLETISEFCFGSKDPEEDARLKAEYFAENQRVLKVLEEKGFGCQGDEHFSAQVQRHFACNPMD